ncbi:DedA family protein [Tessaracoccus coleopterorum]|uniref:DedA family protein n=1 Tax=Tessaracoccus coleopterorum TaxID=2714950 RepID=UPI0018D3513A|nr:VTT domain-containing protein [Tessaracoccus coleopterorum]
MTAGAERTRFAKLISSSHYARATRWLARWGAPAISLSFLTIGIQTVINLAAGITRMPLRRYLPAVTVGSVLWAFLYGTVGFIGWAAVVRLWQFSPPLLVAVFVLAAAGILWSVLRRDSAVRAGTE